MAPGHPSKHQKWSKASKMSLKFVPNLPPGNQKDKPPTIQASKPRVLEVGGTGGSLFNIYIYIYTSWPLYGGGSGVCIYCDDVYIICVVLPPSILGVPKWTLGAPK